MANTHGTLFNWEEFQKQGSLLVLTNTPPQARDDQDADHTLQDAYQTVRARITLCRLLIRLRRMLVTLCSLLIRLSRLLIRLCKLLIRLCRLLIRLWKMQVILQVADRAVQVVD